MKLAWFILKYSPVASLAILLALWFASLFWIFGWAFVGKSRFVAFVCLESNLRFASADNFEDRRGFFAERIEFRSRSWKGGFEFEFAGRPGNPYGEVNANVLMVPIPVVLTLLLPATVGPFWSYRFPLWAWFAWITLIAAETGIYTQGPVMYPHDRKTSDLFHHHRLQLCSAQK